MTAAPFPLSSSRSKWLNHPLCRFVIAVGCTVIPMAVVFVVVESAVSKPWRQGWPSLLAALCCALGYRFYVRRFERRPVAELASSGALLELSRGLALGTGLCLLTLVPLAALGAYTVNGFNDWTALLRSAPEMVLVSVFEEILVRAILFRMVEQAWGSRWALIASILFFVAAHLPAENINGLGIAVTATAAVGFAAAYMVTRRLWLAIGLHFAWNFAFDGVFSVPVSGHIAKGWIRGALSGPTWLSGGSYGVEASFVALIVWAVASALLLRMAHGRGFFLTRGTPLPTLLAMR